MTEHIDANLTHSFFYTTDFSTRQEFLSAVRRALPELKPYDPKTPGTGYVKDLQTAERFLNFDLGGDPQVLRFFDEQYVPLPEDMAGTFLVMVTFFIATGVVSVSCHYDVHDRDTDELIMLRQSGEGRKHAFIVGSFSAADIAGRIAGALSLRSAPSLTGYLCEITTFGGYERTDRLVEERANELYGLITGDEGYEFVPPEICTDRLRLSWGSRDYMRLFAFGQGFLFFNLIGSSSRERYLIRQEVYGNRAYGGVDDYFYMGSCPLTVNHGILFTVEFVLMLKTLVMDVVAFRGGYNSNRKASFYQRIRANRAFRRRIIVVLEKVEGIGISEMGELTAIIMDSQHIAPIVDRVKYLLELLDSDLELLYSARNNILITFLTVLGLAFALIQIIIALI